MQDKLASLSEDFMVTNVPFNFYTSSSMLQGILEKPLEKKAGRNFGPPGTRRLIYLHIQEKLDSGCFCCVYQCSLKVN
jgi:dynein heavy chain